MGVPFKGTAVAYAVYREGVHKKRYGWREVTADHHRKQNDKFRNLLSFQLMAFEWAGETS